MAKEYMLTKEDNRKTSHTFVENVNVFVGGTSLFTAVSLALLGEKIQTNIDTLEKLHYFISQLETLIGDKQVAESVARLIHGQLADLSGPFFFLAFCSVWTYLIKGISEGTLEEDISGEVTAIAGLLTVIYGPLYELHPLDGYDIAISLIPTLSSIIYLLSNKKSVFKLIKLIRESTSLLVISKSDYQTPK